jgi:hypothetical protein
MPASASASASASGGFVRAKDIDPDSEREDKLVQEAIFTNTNDAMSISVSVSVTVSESDPIEYTLGEAIALCLNRAAEVKAEALTLSTVPTTNEMYYKAPGTHWAPVTFGNNMTFAGGVLSLVPAVAFHAHKNGVAQAITTSIHNKLTLGFELYDQGGHYDTTLSRWTPPAGIVHISAGVYVSTGTTANTYVIAAIFKNGGNFKQGVILTPTTHGGSQVSVDDVANGTDYYELHVWAAGTALSVDGSGTNTFFCGHRVR